ncbi:MAG TPA: cell division protein SepF [Acidimicrobiales bacterium]|nr:cell division protein SepF [Acidimicrobiales bacterium]
MASMWRRAMHYLGLGPDDEYDDYDDYDITGEHQRPLAPRQPSPPRYSSTGGVPRVPEPRSSVRTLSPTLGDHEPHANGNSNGAREHAPAGRPGSRNDRAERGAEPSDRLDRIERLDRLGRAGGPGGVDRPGHADRVERADRHDRADRPEPTERVERSADPRAGHAVVRTLVPPAASKPHVVGPSSFDDAQEIADRFKGGAPVILNLQGVTRDLSRRLIDFASGLCYGLDGQMERVANQVYLLTPTDVEVSADERRRLQARGYEP